MVSIFSLQYQHGDERRRAGLGVSDESMSLSLLLSSTDAMLVSSVL